MADTKANFITDLNEFDAFVESLTSEEWCCLDAESEGKISSVLNVWLCNKVVSSCFL